MRAKELVRRLHDLWNTGDVDGVDDVYADDFVAHFPASSEWPERPGRESVRRGIRRIKAAFPDWNEAIEDLFEEGDRVCSRYTSRGTHRGVFSGIEPTGRRIEVAEISIFRVKAGKVVEQWCLVDDLHRLQQLGARVVRP